MNAISYAINDVKLSIPQDILYLVFVNNTIITNSIDEQIMATVVRPYVLVDCNLVGGIEAIVPLSECNVTHQTDTSMVINIPKKLVGGKSVISPLSVLDTSSYHRPTDNEVSELGYIGQTMVNNMGMHNVHVNANLELVGENTILVKSYERFPNFLSIKVVLENNNNLSNLSPRSYPAFAYLVLLSVKRYIYNHMIVRINEGELRHGKELTILKEVVEKYESAEEEYREYLKTTWMKVAFVNDTSKYVGFIKGMMGNNI